MTSNTTKSPDVMQPLAYLGKIIEHPRTQHIILILILINALLLGLETSPSVMSRFGTLLRLMDQAILAVFVIEILIRILVHRLAFFRDPWSLFDFLVIGIALLPATGQFSVLRALRVLRVLRVLTVVPSMRRVVAALLGAIPGLASIALVLGIIYYVFAVIATNLFASSFPAWFGNLGRSLYTLFQIMTLESWSMGIARPVMDQHPLAWMFFITFILIATFTMLNLFIAIIVNAMQNYSESEHRDNLAALDQTRIHIENDLHVEVRALREELALLRISLTNGPALARLGTPGRDGDPPPA